MFGEPDRGLHLFLPSESTTRVLSEFHVVRRVRVDEIVACEADLAEVRVRKLPIGKNGFVGKEIPSVLDRLVSPKRDVEPARTVETAQSVIACPIQIVEKGGRLNTVAAAG